MSSALLLPFVLSYGKIRRECGVIATLPPLVYRGYFSGRMFLSRPILVFDSGIGGLSVLTEIRRQLPNQTYCYLFDNARLPYGELSEADLIQGCVVLVTRLVAQIDAQVVVIACNTASTLVLPALREALTIPVVGVVPAIKPAALLSNSKHIGLLATPGTIKRAYTHELIERFAANCKVELFGSSELVLMAEAKAAQQPLDLSRLAQVLAPIKAAKVDVLVLGCTHFPMLKTELQTYFGEGVLLLDSGEAIANRVKALLNNDAENVAALVEGPISLTESIAIDSENGEEQSQRDEYTDNGNSQLGRGEGKLVAFYTKGEITGGLEKTLADYGFSHVAQISVND